ncbi:MULTISPECIES: hypothetical protein [Enterobacteriaceae]|uniref:Uncharacterized protein n=1 Tax=Pseudenterobacter timonensis TaxID=1755099 RepID=A0AAE4DPI4_9ENTR|nr:MULTISPECIES: hypothetical protein [Enterobacteriaceae]ELY6088831.1 hypothetical protein [Cronobacter sakazakii]MCI0285654.1 hypothetical protein [Cronobacter sakazakii]MDI7341534.1 hypothetical protein [Cronobacter sakazakii]MDI7509953.1 hypothetical protein [Cronobacter sakazakii]MDI7530931.1 hypothetical protein [Cronobacter sakazakii]
MTSTVFALVLHLMVGSGGTSAEMGKFVYEYVGQEECDNAQSTMKKMSIHGARFESECVETKKTVESSQPGNNLVAYRLIQGYLEQGIIQYNGPVARTWARDMQSCQLAMDLTQKEVMYRPSASIALACIPSRQTVFPEVN